MFEHVVISFAGREKTTKLNIEATKLKLKPEINNIFKNNNILKKMKIIITARRIVVILGQISRFTRTGSSKTSLERCDHS